MPDEEYHCTNQKEIFEVHTCTMRENGALSPDVNIADLAANTTWFSGAEIVGMVRAAASYALDRLVHKVALLIINVGGA